MIGLAPATLNRIALLGAHCDDIAIGAGATLLGLCTARPGLRVDALVLTGGGTGREQEERAALAAFCPDAKLDLTVLDLPDGHVPVHWARAKQAVARLRAGADADLVVAPHPADAHQDHRALAEIVPTEFRDHVVLGYEIVKWESDLAQPTVFQPLSVGLAEHKVDLLMAHYPSQHGRSWYDRETFLALARLRGVQCNARYAEAFHAPKLTLDLTGD